VCGRPLVSGLVQLLMLSASIAVVCVTVPVHAAAATHSQRLDNYFSEARHILTSVCIYYLVWLQCRQCCSLPVEPGIALSTLSVCLSVCYVYISLSVVRPVTIFVFRKLPISELCLDFNIDIDTRAFPNGSNGPSKYCILLKRRTTYKHCS